MNDPISPVKGWLERWQGTNVWKVLMWVHKGWDYLRGIGVAPSERDSASGDGGLQGPK